MALWPTSGWRSFEPNKRLDRATIDEYERVLNKLVIPGLGTTIISDLTTSLVDGLLVELGADSLNRQRKANVVLGAMLETAVEVGALAVNPVRGSLSIKRPTPDQRSLTVAELETARAAVWAWLNKDAPDRSRRATSQTSSR